MNRVGIEGRGESIWLGWFLYTALTHFADICILMDDKEQAVKYQQQAEELRRALEAHGEPGWGQPRGEAGEIRWKDSIPKEDPNSK